MFIMAKECKLNVLTYIIAFITFSHIYARAY